MKMRILQSLALGSVGGVIFFVLSGIVTAVLPNQFFTRMTPKSPLDFIFLAISSILLGTYVAIYCYKKNRSEKEKEEQAKNTCGTTIFAGSLGSFFAFACPVCNKILVFLFGATALSIYFEPYRPFLGIISNGLLMIAVYRILKQ